MNKLHKLLSSKKCIIKKTNQFKSKFGILNQRPTIIYKSPVTSSHTNYKFLVNCEWRNVPELTSEYGFSVNILCMLFVSSDG